MRAFKIYFIAVFTLLSVALCFGIYTWILIQKLNKDLEAPHNAPVLTPEDIRGYKEAKTDGQDVR